MRANLERNAAIANSRHATESLRRGLGVQAVVDVDGLTGTPRQVARLDGFLTGPSRRPAADVALGYVRAHASALGITSSDLGSMSLRRDYVDIAGIHHLSWVQSAGGVSLFGNGLQANVTRDGRLLSLGGSPVSGLQAVSAGRTLTTGAAAIAAARSDLSAPAAAGPDDSARQVLFQAPDGTRLGWETITMSAAHPALTVLDSANGQVLYRQPLQSDETSVDRTRRHHSTATAYHYFPGARRGGKQLKSDYTKLGWMSGGAHRLRGNNTHTYPDVNDDDQPNSSEEVGPISPHSWAYKLKPFHLKKVSFCDNPYPCSWNPNKPFSWKTNRNQNANQVFYFVNNWHDHLMKAPIGFTEAAGNFQQDNSTKKGEPGDAVQAQSDDGANTDHGLPDTSHVDNANMSTPPDGRAPRMQMFLQHQPGTSYPDGDPFAPTNVGDEADTVYHEYTHGLSNRLVVDSSGRSTLGPVQAGAMGEAWSDWYAMDYLVHQGLQKDRPRSGDVVLFQYDGEGIFLDRTEPIDCAVGAKAAPCTGGATGHTGGYTYRDYGHIVGGPEVHGDGELWAQTLWDLRSRVGSRVAESIVTRAMELSPANPSFLDERNAILLADMAVYGGNHQNRIWRTFAHRGMGYFAGALNGNDTAPGADFHKPPPAGTPIGGLSGKVTDANSGQPIEGATVVIAWQGSPFANNPSAITDADGNYSVGPVPVGRYPKVVVVGPAGYDDRSNPVQVIAGIKVHNVGLRRDWAALAGGASQTAEGPQFGGCNGDAAIDQSPATVWSSTVDPGPDGQPSADTPKTITITLPDIVDVSSMEVNPAAGCGDGGSASTGDYKVSISQDGGTTWSTPIVGSFVAADRGHLNAVTLPADTTGVTDVRFTMVAPQVFTDLATYPPPPSGFNCPGAFSGCDFQDVTEIEVFGAPSP
ncbi:MAG: M36 family metallopeptidase [Nocardioidaceae bacterium]